MNRSKTSVASRLLARRTIEAEKLWDHPALTGSFRRPNVTLNPMSWVAYARSYAAGSQAANAAAAELPAAPETAAQASIIGAFLLSSIQIGLVLIGVPGSFYVTFIGVMLVIVVIANIRLGRFGGHAA